MTADEAAAIALALAELESVEPGMAACRPEPPWSRIDDPRTWSDYALREALMVDAGV